MKLSIVIVNYNVKAYLEQCLRSVQEALKGLDGEVFVVDNQSTDGSVEMVARLFPGVRLMANSVNMGFSRANNQAIKECVGEYVLLLNPDTVVGEDVFRKVIAFLDANPTAGGLGVKMIDGTGRFLPESKRGLPTPTVAFYKIIGLSRVFPRSKRFGRYHLGHLPENESAPIEILSGACMFLRRSVLDQVGLLDESFFMYGEDIDLSYRIRLGGYENWYFPDAPIIHYKGESTKKSSVNYVIVFYNAMVIFARKHFTRRRPQFFSALIRGAIYLSAAAAIVMRFLRGALLPLVDLALLFASFSWMAQETGLPVDSRMEVLLYCGGVLAILAAFGAYDRPLNLWNIPKGFGALLLVVLLAQGWTPGGPLAMLQLLAMAMAALLLPRVVVRALRGNQSTPMAPEPATVLVVGSQRESKLALGLLWQTHFGLKKEVTMEPEVAMAADGVQALQAAISKEHVDEVVFCAKDMSMRHVIGLLEQLRSTGVVFKISQPNAAFIIGPGTTESLRDLLVLPGHAVNSSASLRRRRTLDVVLSLLLLATLPLGIWFIQDKGGAVRNCFGVLGGKRTWVGYAATAPDRRLPKIRPGVIRPSNALRAVQGSTGVQRADLEYAKDYSAWNDFWQVVQQYRTLGNLVAAN
ncbi:MAG: glycosyltransferase family 2 protein [Flavobacteriales bacterium]|nr:glycosyltransferase family 2 protein [Flavobacteriales bacterium]